MASPLPASDLAADLALVREAAEAAGALLKARFGTTLDVRSKGAAGPVTDVDLAVNDLLRARLCAARPDYGWLSEEGPDDPGRSNARRVFVVDPLDGTRSYIEKTADFCTAVAIVEDGRPIVGVVFAPLHEHFFDGAEGHGARLNGQSIRVSDPDRIEGIRVSSRPSVFAAEKWQAPWPPMDVQQRPAIAYRGALTAAGGYDALIRFGPKWEWDIAAPSAIALAAGAVVTDSQGREIVFNAVEPSADGIVIAGATLHPLLIAKIAAMRPRDTSGSSS